MTASMLVCGKKLEELWLSTRLPMFNVDFRRSPSTTPQFAIGDVSAGACCN